MNASRPMNPSLEPSAQVICLLEEYLEELEAGNQPDTEELVARHPDLAESLRACFASLGFLRDAALSFRGGPVSDMPTSAEGLPVGRLGDFVMLREIGRGGMGVVYEAQQISLGRQV